MRSDSMSKALGVLVGRLGESYGRAKWAWYLQVFNVMPWDECPGEMKMAIYGK